MEMPPIVPCVLTAETSSKSRRPICQGFEGAQFLPSIDKGTEKTLDPLEGRRVADGGAADPPVEVERPIKVFEFIAHPDPASVAGRPRQTRDITRRIAGNYA